jgi:hypothetical protein
LDEQNIICSAKADIRHHRLLWDGGTDKVDGRVEEEKEFVHGGCEILRTMIKPE